MGEFGGRFVWEKRREEGGWARQPFYYGRDAGTGLSDCVWWVVGGGPVSGGTRPAQPSKVRSTPAPAARPAPAPAPAPAWYRKSQQRA